jgi:hypothetical protein
MIVTKFIDMRWSGSNRKIYEELGYIFTMNGDFFKVKTEHLSKGSHTIITVECDNCHEQHDKIYKSYNNCVNNGGFYVCSGCRFEKTKLTNMKNHGVENVSVLPEVRLKLSKSKKENAVELLEKRTKTNVLRYGCENPFQIQSIIDSNVDKCKITKIKNGHILPDEKMKPFLAYKRIVTKLTNRVKKDILLNWNGYDFYDGEFIKDNFCFGCTHSNYPTIDHKISTRYGFENGIPPEEIASIDNLCITKKGINTSKYTKTEEQYKRVKNNYKQKK